MMVFMLAVMVVVVMMMMVVTSMIMSLSRPVFMSKFYWFARRMNILSGTASE
jgi:hypothetical protein